MPGMVNNNTLEAFFRNCVIRQNGTDQLNIFGAYTQPPRTEVAGSYNVAHIKFLEPSPLVQFNQDMGVLMMQVEPIVSKLVDRKKPLISLIYVRSISNPDGVT